MSNARFVWGLIVSLAIVVAACGDDSEGSSNDLSDTGGADVGVDGDNDAAPDSGDADGDASSQSCEAFPMRQIAGTPKTDALAANAAHCGQPAFSWLDVERLGEVTEIGSRDDYRASLLEAVLASEGMESPRELAHDVRVVQYGYMTQDRGELVEASAMLAYPTDEAAEAPREVLLLLHGTTGFTDQCAPSRDLASKALAALFASYGYFVVAPDYVGLKGFGEPTGYLHPYLVGQVTATASLDAVRAAANLPGEECGDWCLSPRVITVGGSQGGHAALWVDRLAPYYAREMELLGVVATVPPADMLGQMDRAIESLVNATGNTVVFLGATAGWYGVEDRLDEVFVSPLDTQVPETLGSSCDFGDIASEPESTADIFTQEFIDAATSDMLEEFAPWGCITKENGLTTTSVERIAPEDDAYGVLFVLGEEDELVHTPIERQSFATLCEQGMQMQFLECAGAGHGETTFFALPEILDFVDARIEGQAFDTAAACQVGEPVQCRGTQ